MPPDLSLPPLPDANVLAAEADRQAHLPAPGIPARQHMPSQEAGPARRRPRGMGA